MDTDTPPTVEIEGLRRSFGPVTAVDGVDLAFDEPTIVGVAGPNGSGKTTLIRCLLGLLAPTAGEVRIDDTPARHLDGDQRAALGYMPQETAIYRDLTVRENVAFFASLYRVADRKAAVDRALSFVGLADRADDRIGSLSGGMVRRTSLACAVVHEPRLLCLDEPTVGLDPELRASMWEGFREHREEGAIVVVSTHYLEEVSRCDEVLFLREGRVLARDSPEVLREQTATDDMEAAFLSLLATDGDDSPDDRGDATAEGVA